MTIPTQRLKYIGYIIDTKQQQLEIPPDKIVETRLKGKEILNKAKKGQKVTAHDVRLIPTLIALIPTKCPTIPIVIIIMY